MIRWGSFVALALALVGCAGPSDGEAMTVTQEATWPPPAGYFLQVEPWREVPAPEDAAEATAAAVAAFGIVTAPEVHWYGGDKALDCGIQGDQYIVGWIIPGSDPARCVGGEESGGVLLVAHSPALKLSRGSLAHELGHMRAWELTGDDDPQHRTRFFAPGGDVERENEKLAARGM